MTSSADESGPDLALVLRDIVAPAVSRVLKPGEVDEVQLMRQPFGRLPGTVVGLVLVVESEQYNDNVYDASLTHMSIEEWRDRLVDNLLDFVAESRFGWGQDRRG